MQQELFKEDIECLTGKIFQGNITPLVYEILKDTKDLKGLLNFLNDTVTLDIEQSIPQVKAAPDFTEWFNTLIAVN